MVRGLLASLACIALVPQAAAGGERIDYLVHIKPIFAALVAFGVGALVALALPSVAGDHAGHLQRIARTVPIVLVVAAVYAGMLWKLGIEAEERAVLAPVFAPLAKIRRKLGKLIR